jgi:hypothetical protein
MKLDAWLKQNQPLESRLRIIERLCQAVNEVHDRGDFVGGLEPGRIALGSEGQCDLSGARKHDPRPPYASPEGDLSTPNLGDIYAVGAIAWEILAGRTAQASPAHLAEVRPDLPRELADAVMACLEESPDWRPNDLTYLAQMAAARQRAAVGGPARSSRAPRPPRAAPKPVRRGPTRRTWPLLVALVVVLGLAALAGRQYLGSFAGLLSTNAARTAPTPRPTASAAPAPATPTPTPAAPPQQAPTTATEATEPEVEPATVRATAGEARVDPPVRAEPARPRDTPAPEPPPTPAEPPPSPATAPPESTPTAVPAEQAPSAIQLPPPAESLPPAVLNAVAPPTVRRPGKVLVDLRGTGLGPGHQARILPVKKVPRGIKVVKQKYVDDTLMTVLLELEESAEPGEYAIAVEDGRGNRSEPLIFEVTK